MLPEIISFNKSLPTRYEEYYSILDEIETACSDINEVWSGTLDLAISATGWQALWMLSESNCKLYDVLYPTAVIVLVNEINYLELSAAVSIVAVQEDIMLPLIVDAPLVELHPIKGQEFTVADLTDIADWLDRCRFFFKYLWYPWDAKSDMTLSDWCSNHLENRLKLQYDIKNGRFDKSTANYLKSLIAEAKDVDDILNKMSSENITMEHRLFLIKNHMRRKLLKVELELFEEPDLRNTMIMMRQKDAGMLEVAANGQETVRIVWPGGTFADLSNIMEVSKRHVDPTTNVKLAGSLLEALDTSFSGDLVLVTPGVHPIKGLGSLESGGVMRGIGNRDETTIIHEQCRGRRAILLECFGPFSFENLTISRQDGIIIQVFEETIRVSNCRLTSDTLGTTRGLVLQAGCHLEMENCELSALGTGLSLHKDATAVLNNCVITECHDGIKLGDQTRLALNNVEITNCRGHAIRLETSSATCGDTMSGGMDLLTTEPFLSCQVSISHTTMKDNKRGDIMIKKVSSQLVIESQSEVGDTTSAEETITVSDDDEFNDSMADTEVELDNTGGGENTTPLEVKTEELEEEGKVLERSIGEPIRS